MPRRTTARHLRSREGGAHKGDAASSKRRRHTRRPRGQVAYERTTPPRWLGAFSQYEQALLAYAAMVNTEVDKCEPLPTTEGGDDT